LLAVEPAFCAALLAAPPTLLAASPTLRAAVDALSATLDAAPVTASVRRVSLRFWLSRKKAMIATSARTAIPMITPPTPDPPRST